MNLRTVAILRGMSPHESQDLAERCWQVGMDLVEVPVQGEQGWAALDAVAERADGRAFGAGTVLRASEVTRAVAAGASVIISPGIHPEVVRATLAAGAVPLPGVMTPSDVTLADAMGVAICKVFPASVVGLAWLGALRGPFPRMRFVAVGGIDADNASAYLQAGAAGVGFSTSVHRILGVHQPAALVARWHAEATA